MWPDTSAKRPVDFIVEEHAEGGLVKMIASRRFDTGSGVFGVEDRFLCGLFIFGDDRGGDWSGLIQGSFGVRVCSGFWPVIVVDDVGSRI